jgi:hypothetical protein
MTMDEAQNGKAKRAGGLKNPVLTQGKNHNLRSKRMWALIFGLALTAAVCAPTKAQNQTPPPTQPVQPGQTQSQTQAPPPTQTTTPTPPPTPPPPAVEGPGGKTAGNYLIQQSIEFGYRDSRIGGNMNNYDTFENLQSGMRLFDYTVSMHSIDHRGIFFDDLTFTNFGYGGDPNNVSRLHLSKNKLYDFRVLFRRDVNYWNYDLLANPLNTAVTTGTNPTLAVANSPHALALSRHMQDYDLTLLPQSRLSFRLGYSRNSNQGLASGTWEGFNEPLLSQTLLYRTSAYRFGVDYKGIPKTTLSFDEFLTYSKIDEQESDNHQSYQLSNGTPIDLGLVFTAAGPWKSTCAITNAASTPFPTVSPTCTAVTSFSEVQNPRSSFPTEHFRFQSTIIKNLSMTGSAGYSSGINTISDFNQLITGWTTAEGTTGGPAQAKRISMTADWSGDYRITNKLYIVDEFGFLDWRSPSMWNTMDTTLFNVPAAAGQTGMLIPISSVTPANFATACPSTAYQAPLTTSNGPLCPVHTSSSAADFTGELVQQFLAQRMITNTIELKYDFARRVSAHIGYVYTDRTIADYSATFDTGEIYLPGGASGANAANDFLAARGDCAKVGGVLPAGCVLNANGSVQEGAPTNLVPEAGNDTGRNLYLIYESLGIVGISARPTDTLRVNGDFLFGYNDNSFTRISPRQVQSYKIHASYSPKPWAHIDGAVDIHENRDNVAFVNNLEHGRTYSFVTTLAPSPNLWIDFGFHYMDIYTQTAICFADSGATAIVFPPASCPVPGNTGGTLGTLSFYASKDYYAYGNVMWKPIKRVTAIMGYAGSIVRGNTTFVNLLQPTGTLDFNYLKPFASLQIDLYKGLSYKTAWNYYGYNDHGIANPVLLAALPSQDFDGSNLTFSLKYAF